MNKTILVVDDEDDLRKLVDFNLRGAGFKTLLAANGEEALQLAKEGPDLIVLDLMLPDIQGTEVCRALKQDDATRSIPVLILSARGEEIDRVVGFEIGAEDYVVKPFSVRELVLRVKALLKRTASKAATQQVPRSNELTFGPLRIDQTRHRVWRDGRELILTALEFKLLTTFVRRKGRVQTRERLLDDVWGVDVGVTTRTVDTHVKRLREKLGESAGYVETVRGVGYRFAEKPDA
jgi:two-component system, OmpR family, phosphate regulon response regulator PhoB